LDEVDDEMKPKHVYLIKNSVVFLVMASLPHTVLYWVLMSSVQFDLLKLIFAWYNLLPSLTAFQDGQVSISDFFAIMMNDSSSSRPASYLKEFLISTLISSTVIFLSIPYFISGILVTFMALYDSRISDDRREIAKSSSGILYPMTPFRREESNSTFYPGNLYQAQP
jgi:hypothetical protein